MISQIPQQTHFGRTINWPVTFNGYLSPARGNLYQYEFNCRNKPSINAKLPLASGNPYVVTVSKVQGQRNKGIQVTVQFKHHTVLGQFHRHPPNKPKGIWIGSDFTNRRSLATLEWHNFISLFGITVGKDNRTIPVYLDFYSNRLIIIQLKELISTTTK